MIIDNDNGLSAVGQQAVTWTYTGLYLITARDTNFSEGNALETTLIMCLGKHNFIRFSICGGDDGEKNKASKS